MSQGSTNSSPIQSRSFLSNIKDNIEKRRTAKQHAKRGMVLALALAISVVGLLSAGQVRVAQAGDDQWTPRGPVGGAFRTLVIDPSNSSILYVGSFSAGVFKSTDSGASWTAKGSGLSQSNVTALRIDPTNPNTLYCATNSGLYKTTNGGDSWAVPSPGAAGMPFPPNDVVIDPGNSNTLYAASSSNVYKSTDGGASWSATSSGLSGSSSTALVFDPTNTSTLYVGFYSGGIYQSTDKGNNWNPMNSGLTNPQVLDLCVDPINNRVIYAGLFTGVVKSTDGGANWTSSGNVGGNAIDIVVDPTDSNVVYVGTNNGLLKSINGGTNWTPLHIGAAVSVGTVAIDPQNPDNMYLGTGAGVLKSTDGAANWAAANSGLSAYQITTLVADPESSSTLYAGTNGSGIKKSTDEGQTWNSLNNFPGSQVGAMTMRPGAHETIYAAANFALYLTTNAGDSWQKVEGLPANALYSDIAIDPSNPQTIYLGANIGVVKTTDGGSSWSTVDLATFGGKQIESLAVDPQHPERVYAGTSAGGAFRSTDRGATWTAANNGFPFAMTIYDLAVDATNGTIYAATNFRVFKSTDGAATWTAISNGFGPNASFVNSITIDPARSTTLYAGTALDGVYVSLDGGANWEAVNAGLSGFSLTINSVVVAASNNSTLYAGTNGVGVYHITLDLVTPFLASATYDGKKTVTIRGRNFGQNPVVLINGVDKTRFVLSQSGTEITLKTKAKKLGLQEGDNTVQIKTSDMKDSNVLTLSR